MDKIILNNGTNLEFLKSNGLNSVTIENKTIEELEKLLTTENLVKVQFSNSNSEVYGNYENLECVSITKYLADESIAINLKEITAP
jgi:RNA-binding protein YhbY